jgi:hypothetical protein
MSQEGDDATTNDRPPPREYLRNLYLLDGIIFLKIKFKQTAGLLYHLD